MAKMTAAEKEKRAPKFLKKIFSSPKKEKAKAAKASAAQGKRNQAATSKMYAAESMFKSAESKDKAKSMSGKAQPFGSAFKSAKASGKKVFLWKGKSYTTKTKSELEAGSKMGKFKKRFDQTSKLKK
jgi:ubiquitin